MKKLKNFGQAPTEYFGYFLGQNGTDSKEYVVSDGSENIRSLTQIISWNDKKGLYPIWSTNEANAILGTDGNNLPPLLGKLRFHIFLSLSSSHSLRDYRLLTIFL